MDVNAVTVIQRRGGGPLPSRGDRDHAECPGELTASVLTGDGWARIVLCASDDAELASWPLEGTERPDLAMVDALARMQLVARRLGCSIRLRGAGAELLGLLDLLGLARVVTDDAAGPGLRLQVVGKPECGEEVGVEEAVVADDPLA